MNENIETSIGLVKIRKAGIEDEEAVLEIMRDAAKWLREKGIPQWAGVLTNRGQEIVHQRVKDSDAYVVQCNGEKIGTVSIMWEDTLGWDEKGLDGSAGYVHGLAILRRFAGKKIGLDILKWAIETIRAERPYVRLDCMAENPKLCQIYENIGFSKVGEKILPKDLKVNLYQKN